MKNKVERLDSAPIANPVGHYTHITKIEVGAELYTFSGQIGTDKAGQLPNSLNKQVENTFTNISRLLGSVGLVPDNVIKVNIWATEPIDWDYFYKEYDTLFGEKPPSMTVGYLVALGLPEIKIEIEIWAAK